MLIKVLEKIVLASKTLEKDKVYSVPDEVNTSICKRLIRQEKAEKVIKKND